MKTGLLIGVVLVLVVGCTPRAEIPTEEVTFSLEQAAQGEYVAARLGDSSLELSAKVSVSVGGVPARVVSFNERVVVFEVPLKARETAELVPVVVSDGLTEAEGRLQILGEVVPGRVILLVLPDVDLNAGRVQALQSFLERENGLFSDLRTVTGEPVGIGLGERRTLLNPLSDTGFEGSIEENMSLLKQTGSPCLGDLVILALDGVPLEEVLQELAEVELPGDGDSYLRGGQSGEEALKTIGIDPTARLFTGLGVTIAVLDSGLDRELFGRPWLETLAYNFVTDSRTNLNDSTLHGTAAALAAAGVGVGVAPAADLLPLKVCDGDDVRCRADHVALGICHALVHAPRGPENLVMNLSFGSPLDVTVHELLLNHAVTELGVGVAASAGNEAGLGSPPHYPAAYEFVAETPRETGDGLVAVAALDAGRPWAGGTRGDYIDVTAPGVNLLDASLGTSFSAPYAAGAVALFKEASGGAMSPGEIEVCLEQGADTSAGFAADEVGSGVLNVADALKICELVP